MDLESIAKVKAKKFVDEIVDKTKEIPKRRPVHEFVKYMMGKAIVLYGAPFVGKSTFIANLARILLDYTGKPARFYWLDRNLIGTELGRALKDISGADVVEIRYPRAIVRALRAEKKWSKYSLVAVDSLTGIAEELTRYYEYPDSPQVLLATTRYASSILMQLAEIAHEHKIPCILIVHESALWTGDFFGEAVSPGYAGKALKNADLVLRFILERETRKDGTIEEARFIKVVLDRVPPTSESKYLGVRINIRELL